MQRIGLTLDKDKSKSATVSGSSESGGGGGGKGSGMSGSSSSSGGSGGGNQDAAEGLSVQEYQQLRATSTMTPIQHLDYLATMLPDSSIQSKLGIVW